jgi:ribosomal protein L37AE/L43A
MEPKQRNATHAERISNECAQCGNLLIAPVWSENLSERRVRHLWKCDACDYSYETMVYLAARDRAA